MLEKLKEEVCKANKGLQKNNLVVSTWGNASAIDRESNLIVIKPSGVPYEELTPEKMVVVDLNGKVIEGDLNPSTDTPTHILLYKTFPQMGSIIHTHSSYATAFAQANIDIPIYGTTHADHFAGPIPCARPVSEEEMDNYEENTGKVIAELLQKSIHDPMEIPACLIAFHGAFIWGKNCEECLNNAIALEEIAKMAYLTITLKSPNDPIELPKHFLKKHYQRKHGEHAYYGQKKK